MHCNIKVLQGISLNLLEELSHNSSVVVCVVCLGSTPGKTRSEGISLKGGVYVDKMTTPPQCAMRDGLGLFINLLSNVISLAEEKSCTRVLETLERTKE